MDLSTDYMGLALRNPLVASASPLSQTVDGVRRLADAGVGAVVLYSLFEEQLRREAAENARLVDAGTESFAESLSYFPAAAEDEAGPRRYLSLLERAAAAVDVPVIGSLNGVTPGGWADYARAMQEAGAAAIELNIYYLPGDPRISGRDVEQRHVDVLTRVKDAVSVPVAVKLSPYFSSTGEMALRLDEAGADALVLFNRFLQPDIDPDTLAVVPARRPLQPGRGAAAAHVDRAPARTGARLARGDHRRRDLGRRRQVPPRRRRRRDDRLGAAAARPRARNRAARRPGGLDGAQGIRSRRRAARDCSPCRPAPTRRSTSEPATSARCGRPTAASTAPGELAAGVRATAGQFPPRHRRVSAVDCRREAGENRADVMPLLYTLFVGIPLCLVAVTFGLLACLTIVGIPIGISLIALGVKALSYPAPTRYQVRITERR